MNRTWSVLPAFVAMMIWICGCGGDAPVVTDDAPAQSIDKPRGGAAAPAAPQGRANDAPAPQRPKAAPQQDDAVASADPQDVFALADGGGNFVIVEDGANAFLASPPPAGVDSSQFIAIPPQQDSPASEPDRTFKLPEGFAAIEDAGYSEQGLPLRIRCEKDGAEMALIPSSISTQGTNDGPSDARPEIAVFLDSYYIDLTEVTLAQYEKYRSWSKESKKRTLDLPANHGSPGDHPALGVNWADARNFAQWAGKQLPTEAEWEKAARGPDGFPHPWGDGRPGWSPPRSLDQIDPVRSFRADISPYGVFDMAGNAREWCADYYSDSAYQEATKNGETVVRNWEGPKRPSIENTRVVKGNGPDWMAWHRWPVHMRGTDSNIGFRCVLRLKSAEEGEAEQKRGATPKKVGF